MGAVNQNTEGGIDKMRGIISLRTERERKGKERKREGREGVYKRIVEIGEKKILITFKVPEQTKKQLIELAMRLDMTITAVVKEALKKLIEYEMEQEIAKREGKRLKVELNERREKRRRRMR